jgi:hypothetical protein
MLNLVRILWSSIFLVTVLWVIGTIGKLISEFSSTAHSFVAWLAKIGFVVVAIGLLVILGWLVFSLINPDNKNSITRFFE